MFPREVLLAVVVRQRRAWRRKDGTFIYFEDNAGVPQAGRVVAGGRCRDGYSGSQVLVSMLPRLCHIHKSTTHMRQTMCYSTSRTRPQMLLSKRLRPFMYVVLVSMSYYVPTSVSYSQKHQTYVK